MLSPLFKVASFCWEEAMVIWMSPLCSGWAATAPGIAVLTFWSTSAGLCPLYSPPSPMGGLIVIALLLLGGVMTLPKLVITGAATVTAAHVGLVTVGILLASVITCFSIAPSLLSMLLALVKLLDTVLCRSTSLAVSTTDTDTSPS